MRYFSVSEAEDLIPEIEKIYAAVIEIAEKIQLKSEQIDRLQSQKGSVAQIAIEKSQLEFLTGGLEDWLRKILDLGAFPKGLNPALVDFPHRLGGKEVYLCWQVGEKQITHYHGIEEGFPGRKKLPAN